MKFYSLTLPCIQDRKGRTKDMNKIEENLK